MSPTCTPSMTKRTSDSTVNNCCFFGGFGAPLLGSIAAAAAAATHRQHHICDECECYRYVLPGTLEKYIRSYRYQVPVRIN